MESNSEKSFKINENYIKNMYRKILNLSNENEFYFQLLNFYEKSDSTNFYKELKNEFEVLKININKENDYFEKFITTTSSNLFKNLLFYHKSLKNIKKELLKKHHIKFQTNELKIENLVVKDINDYNSIETINNKNDEFLMKLKNKSINEIIKLYLDEFISDEAFIDKENLKNELENIYFSLINQNEIQNQNETKILKDLVDFIDLFIEKKINGIRRKREILIKNDFVDNKNIEEMGDEFIKKEQIIKYFKNIVKKEISSSKVNYLNDFLKNFKDEDLIKIEDLLIFYIKNNCENKKENEELKIEKDKLKINNNELNIEKDELELNNNQLNIENETLKIENEELKIKNEELKIKNEELKTEMKIIIQTNKQNSIINRDLKKITSNDSIKNLISNFKFKTK